MDILDLSPEVLEQTADIIKAYCIQQNDLMENYLSEVSALTAEWTDAQTMGTMLDEIRVLKSKVENVMNEVMSVYPQYFRNKADQIRQRPKF